MITIQHNETEKNGIFEVDDLTLAYIRGHNASEPRVYAPDADAQYDEVLNIDLGEIAGAAIEADPDRSVEVDGKTLYASVRQDEESGTTLVGITDQAPDDGDDVDGYCNDISHDDDENAISSEGGEGGEMGWGSGGDDGPHDFGNDISYWPCKKQDDAGGNDL